MDLKNLKRAIEQISEEKGIDSASVLEAVESAIAAAYRKEYGKKGEIVKSKLNLKNGELEFWQIKSVVDENTVRIREEGEEEEIEKETGRRDNFNDQREESEDEKAIPVYNPDRHIFIKEAKKIKKDVKIGDELEFPLEEQNEFGRIASQAAKQVVLQKIREVERESIKKEFRGKEGEIINGTVQRMERGTVYIDLGRTTGVMFYNETIPGEHYRIGERLRFYLLAVQEETRGPGIVLSRAHPKFVSKLFEIEVPEIHEGLVEVKGIAREAGNRSKIAVYSEADGIDPVGSLVGQRGTRVMTVTNELGREKIDIIEWSEDPEKFIAAALSPAKPTRVEISDRREAKVFFPEDQLSLAIGKGGQNVRLAAKLTGWKIDVRSETRPEVVQFESEKKENETPDAEPLRRPDSKSGIGAPTETSEEKTKEEK